MKTFTTHTVIAIVGLVALVALGPASPALAAPTQVTLQLEGIHPPEADLHQGTFTASAPLCASGSWIGNGAGARVFTCFDGSGTFTARFPGELEHSAGATGSWTIMEGSGRYTALRGTGTAAIDFSTGESVSPITFRDTWRGVVDFDTVGPSGSVTRVTVVRPHSQRGRWTVRVAFSARDNVEDNAVTFAASATAGSFGANKSGAVTGGTAVVSFVFRRATATHYLIVEIELTDPWGNRTTIKRKVRLR